MPQTKTRIKTPKKAPVRKIEPQEEETTDSDVASFLSKKSRKEIDIEDDEVIAPVDKLDEAVALVDPAVEEEVAEEEIGLDDEEINPFGDKWEE